MAGRRNPHDVGRILQVLCVTGVVIAVVAATPLLRAASAGDIAPRIDDAEDCLEPVPAAASVTSVTDDGQEVSLDVLVLLDGVDLERGQEVMEKAATVYEPLKIELDVRYEKVAFAPETPPTTDDGAGASPSLRLLDDMKKWTFGERPADSDVVYLLTQKELTDAAGRADCIGGVRYPDAAFAVGENYGSENLAGLFYKNGTAKIAAHEIGHLMGAHHHYANCAEGAPAAIEEMGPNPCSIMFNFLDFLALRFGTLEAATVRGHAVEFAADGPDVLAIHSAAIDFSVGDDRVAGTIESSDSLCSSKVEIRIQRYDSSKPYEDQEWVDVASGRSRRSGAFKIKVPVKPGQYRAFAPEHSIGKGDNETVCAQAASAPETIDS